MVERRIERTGRFESDVEGLDRRHRDFAQAVDEFLKDEAQRDVPSGSKIPGLGGDPVYKVRLPLGDKGKRGGARLIYYRDSALVLAMYAYAKSDTADIPVKQISDALSSFQSD